MWWGMVAATMLPLIGPNVRFVALRSPRRRRATATVDVVAGWAVVWTGVAVVLWAGTTVAARSVGPTVTLLGAFGAAMLWQGTRTKRVHVARCHRTLSPPLHDRTARLTCWRFGAALGADCAASCWALMTAMAATGHSLVVVVPLAWVSWFERKRPHHKPPRAVGAIVIAATAATVMALGVE